MNLPPSIPRRFSTTTLSRGRLIGYIVLFALRDIFPVSFFGRDLRERASTFLGSLRSCIGSFLNLTTLTILVGTVALVAGLYTGTVGWLKDYVEANPLARTVETSSMFGVRTSVFEEKDLESLRRLEVGDGVTPVEAVHGWNDVTFWLFDAQGGMDDSLTHGRTVNPADPLLDRLQYRSGEGSFRDEGIGQVLVSESLLDALDYGRELPHPEELFLDYFDLAGPMEVVGVAEHTPAGDFLITESFHRAIQDRRWDPLPRIPGFYWGPIEPTPDFEALLAKMASYFAGRRVTVEIVRRAGVEHWLAFRRSEAWTEEQWRQLFLPVVQRRLGEKEPKAVAEWMEALDAQLRPREALEKKFTRASLYVAELAQVPAVAEAVTAEGFQVTSNSRELALLFLQISSLGRGILLAVILVVGGLAAVSLVLSFTQSIQRKTPEIAILKAFGASNALVLGAYILEALILWALSMVTGLLLAAWVARGLDQRLVSVLQLRGHLPSAGETHLVSLSFELQAWVAFGALGLCAAATLLAGSLVVRLQPARALNLHR